ncbi:hypothetical protein HYPSUDRAFT_146365, partial [Hypholoma sublateritium FD-334 SS-4]
MASLDDVLTTNIAPNDEQQENLKRFVRDCDDKLKIVNTKISELEAQLRILNDEKAAILESVAPFRRALSPFRQLPEDIVREIFVASLETRRNPTMANTEAPVLLTQVSSATRRIALSTPALWAAIHIPILSYVRPEFMDEAKSVMASRANGVEEWLLRRSGNLPLHISVYQSTYPAGEPDFSADDVMGVLKACCSRWKSLYLCCPDTSLSRISSVAPSDAPLLHSLTFHPESNDIGYSNFWKSSKLMATPELRRFSQLGDRRAFILDYPVPIWANLTHLRCAAE